MLFNEHWSTVSTSVSPKRTCIKSVQWTHTCIEIWAYFLNRAFLCILSPSLSLSLSVQLKARIILKPEEARRRKKNGYSMAEGYCEICSFWRFSSHHGKRSKWSSSWENHYSFFSHFSQIGTFPSQLLFSPILISFKMFSVFLCK